MLQKLQKDGLSLSPSSAVTTWTTKRSLAGLHEFSVKAGINHTHTHTIYLSSSLVRFQNKISEAGFTNDSMVTNLK